MAIKKKRFEDIHDAAYALEIDADSAATVGRYEYSEGGSDKFYELRIDTKTGEHVVTWGRNGRPPQGEQRLDKYEAIKRVREKLAKGYRRASEPIISVEDGFIVAREKSFGIPERDARISAAARMDIKREVRKAELDEKQEFLKALKKL
jgi:predicted DNA-binding WGR domain protein